MKARFLALSSLLLVPVLALGMVGPKSAVLQPQVLAANQSLDSVAAKPVQHSETTADTSDPDNDGIPTSEEDVNGDGDSTNDDTDHDGIPNYLDGDDDGDGILTKDENNSSTATSSPTPVKTSTPGTATITPLLNSTQTPTPVTPTGSPKPTTTSPPETTFTPTRTPAVTTTSSYKVFLPLLRRQTTALSTQAEGSQAALAALSLLTSRQDTDQDGIPDYLENNSSDLDSDGITDNKDNDDDGDGILTIKEKLTTDSKLKDTDNDGYPDYQESNILSSDDSGKKDFENSDYWPGLPIPEKPADAASAEEQLIVPISGEAQTVTTNAEYEGLVTVFIEGGGREGTGEFRDAFYSLTDSQGKVSSSPLVLSAAGSANPALLLNNRPISDTVVGGIPAYQTGVTYYRFQIKVGRGKITFSFKFSTATFKGNFVIYLYPVLTTPTPTSTVTSNPAEMTATAHGSTLTPTPRRSPTPSWTATSTRTPTKSPTLNVAEKTATAGGKALTSTRTATSAPTATATTTPPCIGGEALTVPFMPGSSVPKTTRSYSGRVNITATGIGQAFSGRSSDAFYLLSDSAGSLLTNPQEPSASNGFLLMIDGQPAQKSITTGSIPSYKDNHTYQFSVLGKGTNFIFGIGDPNPSSNTGQLLLTVCPATMVPFVDGVNALNTTLPYSGLVQITVSGTGQALGTRFSDAFFVFTDSSGNASNPWTPTTADSYVLMINGQPASSLVKQWVIGPDYRSDHLYTFVIDAGTTPRILTFGVGEANPAGNTGGYNIDLLAISALPTATPTTNGATNTPTNTPNPNGATNTPTTSSAGLAVTLDSANPTTLEAGKVSDLTAHVTENGAPPVNENTLTFTTNGGTFNPTETTTSLGDATTQLTAPDPPPSTGSIKVRACIKGTTTCSALSTITISPKPVIVFSTAPATTLEVDTTANFTAKVTVSDAAVAKNVTFTTTGGSITSPATSKGTTSSSTGELAGTVKSPSSVPASGKITVSACIDGYTPAICTTQDIMIKTKPIIALSFPSLGIEILKTGKITATVTQGGSPIAVGKNVSFSILSGGGTLDSSNSAVATDANGQALATLTAPAAKGTVSIKACFDSRTDVCDTQSVTIKPQPTITLAVPASIAAGATSTNGIVATVAIDSGSTGVVRNVTFSTTGGTLSSLSGTTTDGVSKISLTVPASKFGRITVTACVKDGSGADYNPAICASKVVKVTCVGPNGVNSDDFRDVIASSDATTFNASTAKSTWWTASNPSTQSPVTFGQTSADGLQLNLPGKADATTWTTRDLSPRVIQSPAAISFDKAFCFETEMKPLQAAPATFTSNPNGCTRIWEQGIFLRGDSTSARTVLFGYRGSTKTSVQTLQIKLYRSTAGVFVATDATVTPSSSVGLKICRAAGTSSVGGTWTTFYNIDGGAWTSLSNTIPTDSTRIVSLEQIGLYSMSTTDLSSCYSDSPPVVSSFNYFTNPDSCNLLP